MSVTYVVENFNFQEKSILFKVYVNFTPKLFEVVFNCTKDLEIYEGVNRHLHYVDENGDIVNIINTQNSTIVERGGKKFIKARQWQYDKWMFRNYPDSINARVYNTLCTNSASIATSSV